MKIILFKENRHVVMQVTIDPDADDILYERWDHFVIDLANDLKDRSGVRRMSYDSWWWDERKAHEAEEYVTYFYLKHGE